MLGILVFTSLSFAEIRVAFFRCFDSQGKLVEFVPGGQFCHVAIGYRGGWLHAHPVYGVEWKQGLEEIKVAKYGLTLLRKSALSLSEKQVNPWLGVPYDPTFRWDTERATYCSKLVGKFLNITPKIMTFETPYWKNFKNLPENELGISPDAIYSELVRRGYDTY